MSGAEGCLLGVAAVGLLLWTRACAKHSAGSCALGLLRGVVAAGGYLGAFSLTRTSYMEGWLCPALLKFFPRAPQHIYARAEAK